MYRGLVDDIRITRAALPAQNLAFATANRPISGNNDTDNDGLDDFIETFYYHTNPNDNDTDADKIPDGLDNLALDHDNDKIPDELDIDDDSDGIADDQDPYPLDTLNDAIPDSQTPDMDNDTVPDTADAFPFNPLEWNDTDNDSIGDNYETVNGTLILNPEDDCDGDGQTNLEEFLAGTQYDNAGSVLTITNLSVNAKNEVTISWSTVPGKQYIVESAQTPINATPKFVPLFQSQRLGVAGQPTAQYTDSFTELNIPPNNSTRLYRVRVIKN